MIKGGYPLTEISPFEAKWNEQDRYKHIDESNTNYMYQSKLTSFMQATHF